MMSDEYPTEIVYYQKPEGQINGKIGHLNWTMLPPIWLEFVIELYRRFFKNNWHINNWFSLSKNPAEDNNT